MTSGRPRRIETALRLTTVAVVLALVLGPLADLLCRVVCVPHTAATSNCHRHGAGVTVVAASGECHSTILTPAGLPPDATRRGLNSGDAGDALCPTGIAAASPRDCRELDSTASPWRQFDRRPLSTILRI
jgi:hypothetical protein